MDAVSLGDLQHHEEQNGRQALRQESLGTAGRAAEKQVINAGRRWLDLSSGPLGELFPFFGIGLRSPWFRIPVGIHRTLSATSRVGQHINCRIPLPRPRRHSQAHFRYQALPDVHQQVGLKHSMVSFSLPLLASHTFRTGMERWVALLCRCP